MVYSVAMIRSVMALNPQAREAARELDAERAQGRVRGPLHGIPILIKDNMLPAIAGYPHVTVPMGQISGLPVGLSFIGPAWSDAQLLQFAYAYEQRTRLRRPPPL